MEAKQSENQFQFETVKTICGNAVALRFSPRIARGVYLSMMLSVHAGLKAGVGPFLDRRQRERNAYCYRRAFPTRGDKAVRAQSIRGRMALQGLYVPIDALWYPDVRSELLSFPAGKHDDIIDALGLIGQLLDHMVVGDRPPPPPEPSLLRDYVTWEPPGTSNDWMVH
jgi:hypothetical protein